jgi:hypothetical protein
MLKFFLKIYPAFLPILIYLFWIYVVENLILQRLLRKEKVIKGEKIVGEKASESLQAEEKIGKFSLQNRHFVVILYLSLVLAILTLVMSAFA